MNRYLLVLSLCFSGGLQASESVGTVPVVFANDSASVLLPTAMSVVAQEEALVARFGAGQDHTLELSFNPMPTGGDGTGVGFVRAAAAKAGASVTEGPDRVAFMELAGDVERDGQTFRVVHWQVGVAEGVFVLTITAPMPMSPDLSDFLGSGLNMVVNSVSAGAL